MGSGEWGPPWRVGMLDKRSGHNFEGLIKGGTSWFIKKAIEQLYTKKCENLDKMDNVLEKHK